MKLNSLHRILILVFGLFCCDFGWGQVALVTDNFGTVAQNPMVRTGWTTNTAGGTVWEIRTTGASTGYSWTLPAGSASGGGNVMTNLGTNTGTKQLTYDNALSTVGYTSIQVRFGALRNATVPNVNVLYSVDGVTYTSAGTVALTTAWAAYSINLPVGAEGVSNLRIRFEVVANNSTANFLRIDDFSIIGTAVTSPPVITSSLTASGIVGSVFSYAIAATNTPTSYNATGLPAGLSINTTTGVISGTPTSAAVTNVTITATNASGSDNKTLVITVTNPPAPVISSALTASGIVGSAFSYSIVASNTPTSYSATGLPAGLSINTTTGVISGTPTTAAVSSVTITATNAGGTDTKTLVITITNPPAPSITSALTASGVVGTAFSYAITATNAPTSYNATGLPAGLSINTTTGLISGTPSAVAVTSVTITATNAGGTDTKIVVITITNPPAPVITSSLASSGSVGVSYSYTITATNTPTSYNATGLPAGLSINTTTGVISGTPTTAAVTSVTITATNAGGTGTATLVITVTTFTPLAGDFRSTVDFADMSWNNTAGATTYWEYFNGTSWGATPGDKAPQNATTTPSRVIIKNIGVTGGGNTTKTYNDIVIFSGGELILQANDAPPVAAEFLFANKTLEVQSGGILRVEGDIDLPTTGNLIVRSGANMYINQASINNIHPMWDGIENFENNSTLEINNWDFAASATNASLINISGTITNNSGGWKFGNLIYNVNTGLNHWTIFGGNGSGAGLIVNLTQNDFTISNASTTNYIIGATNKTGTNGFVVNGNMTINAGNFTFGTSFSADVFSHQFTINGNFVFNSTGTLLVHRNNTVATNLTGFVNFKGNVTVASTATFNTDKATDNSRMYININGTTSTQFINVGCTATGTNWFVKSGAVAQFLNNNLTFNSLTSLTSTLTVEDGATLHFGWASNGTTPLYYTQASTLTGVVAFASNSGSTLKITSADGVVKNTANLGNVQIPVAQKTFNQDATFWYVGKENQNVGDAVGSTGVRNLTIETNPSSLVVTMNMNDIKVNSFLTLTSGVLATGSYLLSTMSTTASNLIHTVGNASFVYGNLRRYIASNTSTYEFPLGDGVVTTNYKRLDLINNSLITTSYITGSVASVAQGSPAADVDANLSSSAMLGSTQLGNLLNAAIWNLQPDAQPTGGSYGVNLYVENVSNLSSADDNNFCPVKRADASATYADWSSFLSTPTAIPGANSAGRIYNAGAGYAQRTGYAQFSFHAIAKVPIIVLPMELVRFSATCKVGNSVNIEWITANENNNDYFTIERSEDAINFEKIKTKSAAGNSSGRITYSDVDNEPIDGVSYYRLKQTDYNGEFKYSNIISFNKTECENTELTIVKTIGSIEAGYLEVFVNGGAQGVLNVELIDMLGKRIYYSTGQTYMKNEKIIIPTSNISGGIYLIKISNQTKCVSKKLSL